MFAKHAPQPSQKNCYVSEFTVFMQDFLVEHPEVVADQRRGWNLHWDHQVDFDALDQAQHDSVPAKANENFLPC